MKKMLMMAAAPLMIALAVLMIGCASTKGFLGLATVSTMEAELAQIRRPDTMLAWERIFKAAFEECVTDYHIPMR